jgi:hypothetical protein
MATSITRWSMSAWIPLGPACATAIQPYIDSGATDGTPMSVVGPNDGIPADQYETHRTWTTTAGAQAWLDQIDSIAAGVGCVCLEKRLVS